MRTLHAAVLVLALALVPTTSALAGHLDPVKRIRAADQARAQAMLLGSRTCPASSGSPRLDATLISRARDWTSRI